MKPEVHNERTSTSPVKEAADEASADTGMLEELIQEQMRQTVASSSAAARAASPLVGECLDAHHPTLTGRVRVRWTDGEGTHQQWVPTLQSLPVRQGDRVLLLQPANVDERVVIGVLDGFTRRPEPTRKEAAALELKRDETLRVEDAGGQPLIELFQTEAGPVVRFLEENVNLELPGELRVKASHIEFKADEGSVVIEASDDVNVRGEIINLN